MRSACSSSRAGFERAAPVAAAAGDILRIVWRQGIALAVHSRDADIAEAVLVARPLPN